MYIYVCMLMCMSLQIEPNVARVNIPDDRFKWLLNLYHPKSEVPAFLEVVDIAGMYACFSSPKVEEDK